MRSRKESQGKVQPDLFVPYLSDLALRDQRETMERPFFSLSKRKRITPIEYRSPDGSVWVKVEAVPAYGMATIWDADILIWVASTLVEMRERGVTELPRTLRFHPYNLLKAIQRDVGGDQYKRLREALERLKGTLISTNIRGDKKTRRAMFGWLDDWSEEIEESTQQTKEMTITLSNWIYQGIIMQGGVLSVHPDYFLLTGGLERCLYRIARKHAGMQAYGWTCTVSTLYEKTGSESSRKEFTRMLRKIVTANTLPEYHLSWIEQTESGDSAVHMIRRSVLPASHPEFSFPTSKSKIRPLIIQD
jgi:plasmid replication initiation protein